MTRKETRRKERRKNGSWQRAKPSTPSQAADAFTGDEEQNGKQKIIYLFIIREPTPAIAGVGARQYQVKISEKSEEKEKDRGTNPGNWRAHREGRAEQKNE